MIHGGQFLGPFRFGLRDGRLALGATGVAGRSGKFGQDTIGHFLGIADNAHGDRLGEPDAIGIDVHLNNRRTSRPVVDAVARQGRKGVQTGAQRQDNVSFGNQLHTGFRAIVTQGAGEQRVTAREGVIVLITAADRRVQTFGHCHGVLDGAADHHTAAVQNDRELGIGKQFGRPCDSVLATGRTFEIHNGGQFDLDHLGPEIPGNIDLGRGRSAFGLHDHPVEDLGDAGGMQHLFLIGHHVLKDGHLRNFLEAALAHGHVGRLGGDQQQRGVVPVGRFHRGNEIGDAGAVLGHHHGHLAGSAGEAVGHHAGIALMPAIPERNAGFGKQVGNRHHGRSDDAKRVFDAMHLQNFHKSFFGGHFLLAHCPIPP